MTAARQLGYRPNILARSLMTQRTGLVGVVMGQLRNPFFTSMLERFEQRFRDGGLKTLLMTCSDAADVDQAMEQALQYHVDALVTAALTPSAAMVRRCAQLGVPVVTIDRQSAPAGADHVWIDSAQVGRQVAQVLMSEGRRRFAVVEGWPAPRLSTKARAFRDCLLRAGHKTVAVDCGAFTYEGGLAAAMRLLTARQRPDALFCVTDLMAFGALDAARQVLGLQVPGELSVMGFGDLSEAGWLSHKLSTVALPIGEIVDSAVASILGDLRQPGGRQRRIKLPCTLVLRETTGSPARAANSRQRRA